MKICNKCGLKYDGVRCKECHNRYKRDSGHNKYARRAAYLSAYQRKIRATDKNKQYDKGYRSQYKESFAGVITDLLCAARKRAKMRGLEIDLDRAWVEAKLQAMKCEASGINLTLKKDRSVSHTPFRPSIDRIDNNKGYTKDNCRIVAVIYNKAKSDYTDEDVSKLAISLTNKILANA